MFASYKDSLNRSHSEWKDSVIQRGKNAEVFYNDFFKDLIINNGLLKDNPNFKTQIIQKLHIRHVKVVDDGAILVLFE